ncbi:MAG: sulfite exporter TauE/SafE family protein [Chthonomonas sp.]|nr:sulfite exporter TauE/SafE family protein [Chthonomonas sp.]
MTLTAGNGAFLLGAGVLSGALNAIAGGGSLVSFPAMLALGVPSVTANASNAFAQWPGSASAAWGFRNRWPAITEPTRDLWPTTLIGGVLGAVLLLATPARVFDFLVPALVLFATLLLARTPKPGRKPLSRPTIHGLQFATSLYGGYFGAGMGILMMALFRTILPDRNIHDWNALKSVLAVLINLSASLFFVVRGQIAWAPCLLVMAGSMLGGLVAARVSQRVDPSRLKSAVVVYGLFMTIWLTMRAFGSL